MKVWIFIEICLILGVKSQWSESKIIPELNGYVSVDSGYADQNLVKHHISGIINDTMYHLKMSSNFQYEITTWKQYSNIQFDKVSMGGNENNVFLVSKGRENGNWNIYFTESEDSGKTWKPIIKIIDNVFVTSLSLNYLSDTGRLFLFYTKENPDSACYITRSPGSTVWSNEKLLFSGDHTTEITFFNAKMPGKKEQTLFIGIESNGYLYTSYSINMGVTWSEFKIIGKGRKLQLIYTNEKLYAFYLTEPIALTTRVFRYSLDMGNIWSQRKILEEVPYYSELSAILCQTSNTLPIIAAFSARKRFEIIDTMDNSINQISSPYMGGSATKGAVLACGQYDLAKSFIHSYVALENEYHLLYSYGYFPS